MLDKNQYNPDVLNCLANLSNDEVFTPPHIVNKMLDILPQDLFKSTTTTFLDPVCKSGVFLREITKRLLAGLEAEIPDLQTRINHIFKNQIFGIAITDLTALMARRTVYCAKKANGDKAVTDIFDTEAGNIIFETKTHEFKGEKCVFCGASQAVYDRDETHETHAYPFIHTHTPQDIFKMKFDVIIGNPPYQMSDGGASASAKPLYHKFVEQAKKLNPRFLTMIIPARWYAGGKGLDDFRKEMLNDKRISHLVDYTNANDCFVGLGGLSGGVCYFLWEKDYNGICNFTNIHNGKTCIKQRHLDDFKIFIRYNESVEIINKIKKIDNNMLSKIVSPINSFGLSSSFRGDEKNNNNSIKIYHSKGYGYLDSDKLISGKNIIDKHKVMVSRTIAEHAGEPNKDGKFKIISKILSLNPNEACTHSYLILGTFDNQNEAKALEEYIKTKFVRFLILQTISSIDLSREKFQFVPLQDFSESWTDEKLYAKYGLTSDEIAFIDSMIRPME